MLGSRYENEIFGKSGLNLKIVDIKEDARWEVFKGTLQKSLLLLNQFQDRRIAASKMMYSATSPTVKLMSFWHCQQHLFNILLDNKLNISSEDLSAKVSFINKGIQTF